MDECSWVDSAQAETEYGSEVVATRHCRDSPDEENKNCHYSSEEAGDVLIFTGSIVYKLVLG